jgi:hypothetical protein
VRWVIACNIVGTPSSRNNLNLLSWNKVKTNILIECFSGIYSNFIFVQGEMKNSQGINRIYHVIKSVILRKLGSELSNNVLTLVRLRNDFIE